MSELRALTRDRERLIFNQRDVENQLRAIVHGLSPAVLHLFSSLDRRHHAWRFCGTTPAPAGRPGRYGPDGGLLRPARLLRADPPELLVERCGPTCSAPRGHDRREGVYRAVFIDQLELLNSQIRLIRSGSGSDWSNTQTGTIFLSFPGMGDITAAIMLAEMGEDRARFPTADVLLAETGTAPVTRSSGRSRHRPVPLRREQADAPRHRLVGFVAVRENDWAHEAYHQARARGQLHNRALRGVGARWTRILWRCWTDHTTYDPTVHLKQPAALTAKPPTNASSRGPPARELR